MYLHKVRFDQTAPRIMGNFRKYPVHVYRQRATSRSSSNVLFRVRYRAPQVATLRRKTMAVHLYRSKRQSHVSGEALSSISVCGTQTRRPHFYCGVYSVMPRPGGRAPLLLTIAIRNIRVAPYDVRCRIVTVQHVVCCSENVNIWYCLEGVSAGRGSI